MKRALHLSTLGGPRVSPNPFVGAVIVARERIIGEGYHRQFGEAHAEVNAVAYVRQEDRPLLPESTMYVTLEPCSHFGKTPPCADLIIRESIPHVVIAAPDPFLKDYESGIDRLRNTGVRVEVGLMRREAEWINRRFFTAHRLKRPFVLLKWAQSADGLISGPDGVPVRLSNPFTLMLMHRERAYYDAVMVGTNTVVKDNPKLTCRLWPARDCDSRPLKVTFNSPNISGEYAIEKSNPVKKQPAESLQEFLERLYRENGVTSLMVEGGARTLESFLQEGLFDELRIETSPGIIGNGVPAPDPAPFIREAHMTGRPPLSFSGNTIRYFVKNY